MVPQSPNPFKVLSTDTVGVSPSNGYHPISKLFSRKTALDHRSKERTIERYLRLKLTGY
jgi:hypothetical protein